jgi:hypothetical protein
MKSLLPRRVLPLIVILGALVLPAGASATVPDITFTSPVSGSLQTYNACIQIVGTSSNIDVTGYYYLDGVGPDPESIYTAYAFGAPGTRTIDHCIDVSGLSDGLHNLQAGAVPADNPGDRTAIFRQFLIDHTAPVLTFTPPVADGASTTETSFSWTFSSTDNYSFHCSIDGGLPQACGSPVSTNNLSDGQHSFSVYAGDQAGNQSEPQGVTFTVNTAWLLPPETTFTSKPEAPSTATSANFAFTSTTAISFECSLDGAAYAACSSPHLLTGLAVGDHVFSVRGKDPTDQLETTPEVATFTVLAPAKLDPPITVPAPTVSKVTGKGKKLSISVSGPGVIAVTVEACAKKQGKTVCKSFTTGSATATAAGKLTISLKKKLKKKSKYRVTFTGTSSSGAAASSSKTIKAK